MVRRAQAALRSVEHTSVRQLRVLAAIVFLFAMVIATVAPAVTAPMAFADSSTSSSSVDYATWAEVSKAMDKQLNSGLETYKDGNTAGATSDFMGAYNKIYVASNFTAVVHDTIGADKQLAQQQAFQSVQNLSYTPSNDDQLAQQIDALTADLDATAQQLDANADLAKPKAYAEALQAQLAKERKELDAKKKKNPGKGNRSWTDVANEMTPILDNAYKAYEKGDGAKGATLVNNAYYQYYEKLGFEKNVMNAISGNRVSQVEYQFKMCRKSMNAGASLKDTKKLIDDLKAMLIKDAGILDGGAADKEDGFTKLVTSSSGQAFLVLIREGLEALLVVAAIVAYLVKSDNKRFVKWIYLGVLVGLLGAGLVAVIFVFAFGGSGPIQEIMEGTCALIAMGMLLWTSNWMLNKSSVEAWNRYIRKKTEAAVADAEAAASADNVTLKTVVSLAMLSFLAVFREGAETVIFYESIYTMSRDTRGMWIGDRRGGACRHLPALPLHLREDSDWSVLPGHFDSDVCAGGGVRRRRRPLADRGRLAARLLPERCADERLAWPLPVRRMPSGAGHRSRCGYRAVRGRLHQAAQAEGAGYCRGPGREGVARLARPFPPITADN